MGSSGSKDAAAPDTQDRVLQLKLAMIGRELEPNVLLARRYTDHDYGNNDNLHDSLEFVVHETAVDGQEVRLRIWRLS